MSTVIASNEEAKAIVKTGFDAIAPDYLDFITKLPSPNLIWTDKLLSALTAPSDARVLDLGCGNGVPCTKHLAERVKHVTANDFSAAQIALAKEKLSDLDNIVYINEDMTMLGYSASEFDGVSALYSLQHLPLDEQPAMLAKIRSWLKPGGILLCNFDEAESAGTVMDDWLGSKMFLCGLGVERSKEMVQEAGFEILEAEVVSKVDGKNTVPFFWILAKRGE